MVPIVRGVLLLYLYREVISIKSRTSRSVLTARLSRLALWTVQGSLDGASWLPFSSCPPHRALPAECEKISKADKVILNVLLESLL